MIDQGFHPVDHWVAVDVMCERLIRAPRATVSVSVSRTVRFRATATVLLPGRSLTSGVSLPRVRLRHVAPVSQGLEMDQPQIVFAFMMTS